MSLEEIEIDVILDTNLRFCQDLTHTHIYMMFITLNESIYYYR